MKMQPLFAVAWVCCSLLGKGTLGDELEYRLTRYLMANYDPSVRPAHNSSQPLTVMFGLSLHSIIDVDEKNQILTSNCWLTHVWTDAHLTWNSSDFGGVRVIRMPFDKVWRPDIILYNNADAQYGSSTINTNVIVASSGRVTWLSHGIYRSSCEMNVEYFPFDVQACELKWASWTYDGHQLDLKKQADSGDVSNYQTNGEFTLVEFSAVLNVEYYSCCVEPYPDITYTIVLRRRPMFYVFNLILPCLLINSIALLVFYVPNESGEKVTLGISALLSMMVFLMTTRESLPPTEKTPLISLYYGITICLVSFASGLSVVTLNIHHRGVRGLEVPQIVKRVILGWLARLVFLRFDEPEGPSSQTGSAKLNDLKHECDVHVDSTTGEKFHINEIDHMDLCHLSPRFRQRHFHITHNRGSTQTLPFPPDHVHTLSSPHSSVLSDDLEQQFLRVLSKVHRTIEKNEMRHAEQERREATRAEWRQVSLVCDCLLLLCFSASTVVATTCVLLSSSHGP